MGEGWFRLPLFPGWHLPAAVPLLVDLASFALVLGFARVSAQSAVRVR